MSPFPVCRDALSFFPLGTPKKTRDVLILVNVLDRLLLQLLNRLRLGVFSLDDGLGFGLREKMKTSASTHGSRSSGQVKALPWFKRSTHSQSLIPSRCVLRVRALLRTRQVLLLLLLELLGVAARHLPSQREMSMTRKDDEVRENVRSFRHGPRSRDGERSDGGLADGAEDGGRSSEQHIG